jgi:hypothetical protein
VQFAEFAKAPQGVEAGLDGGRRGGGERDLCEGGPEVFAQGAGDGFFAVVGDLAEGVVVLGAGVSCGSGRVGSETRKRTVRRRQRQVKGNWEIGRGVPSLPSAASRRPGAFAGARRRICRSRASAIWGLEQCHRLLWRC